MSYSPSAPAIPPLPYGFHLLLPNMTQGRVILGNVLFTVQGQIDIALM
jgi:hypothetical protein